MVTQERDAKDPEEQTLHASSVQDDSRWPRPEEAGPHLEDSKINTG